MKRTGVVLGALVLGAVVALTPGCKKGPEDPFISLKSRDARIKGNWELVALEYSYSYIRSLQNAQCSSVINSQTIKSEDGKTFVSIDTITRFDPFSETCSTEVRQDTTSGYFEMTINKDGTYSYTSSFGTFYEEGNGYWFWADSRKNKLYIAFDMNTSACVWGELAGDNLVQGQWYIERLSSKELILTSKCKNVYSEDGNTYTSIVAFRMVFAKKKK